jgi:peptidyl-prolyl cis-trans isomerase A (cyclophilin A)
MARTMNPNSATAQFFINVVDNPNLNAPSPDGFGYAVFGNVTQGMDVIDKIRKVPTGFKNGYSDVPLTPVTIQSITLLK